MVAFAANRDSPTESRETVDAMVGWYGNMVDNAVEAAGDAAGDVVGSLATGKPGDQPWSLLRGRNDYDGNKQCQYSDAK